MKKQKEQQYLGTGDNKIKLVPMKMYSVTRKYKEPKPERYLTAEESKARIDELIEQGLASSRAFDEDRRRRHERYAAMLEQTKREMAEAQKSLQDV